MARDFVNADVLFRALSLDAYTAAIMAAALRHELVTRRESFVFETVFSDPVGEKLAFLKDAVSVGYRVVLCFVGVFGPDLSAVRVAMRVSQGGHDVPSEKLIARSPRTRANLRTALRELSEVRVYDHDDLRTPFRPVSVFENGQVVNLNPSIPSWLKPLLP
jgi:predicted ABC-type ATPase